MKPKDAHQLLEQKGKVCSKDLQETFNIPQPHAARMLSQLLKFGGIEESLEIKKRKDGAPYAVKYAKLTKNARKNQKKA